MNDQTLEEQVAIIDSLMQKGSPELEYQLQNLLKEHPKNKFLQGAHAYTIAYAGDLDRSESLIKDYRLLSGEHAFLLLSEGVVAGMRNKPGDALRLLEKALLTAGNLENKWLRLELFYAYNKLENHKLAWKYIEEALEIDPHFIPARIAKSYSLDHIINCSEIIDLLATIVETVKDADIYAHYGAALYNCKKIAEAEHYLQKSLAITPMADVYYTLGHIDHYEKGAFSSALEKYQMSEKLDSRPFEVYNSLGWLHYDLGNEELAELNFLKLIEIDPSAESYNQLIQFYLNKKNLTKARYYNQVEREINGKSFYNKGVELVIEIMANPTEKSKHMTMLKVFQSEYDEAEVIWLNDILENLNSN